MSSVPEINKAAFEGNLELLNDLITAASAADSSFSVDKLVDPNDSNRGPLHFAILGKQIETVRVLLERFNCSPFLLDDDGWSPLHVASSVGSEEIIELLAEAVGNWPSAASTAASEDAVALYFNQPTQGRTRQYPLHLAASKGHEKAVLRLLCHGANGSVRNSFGQTPLHRAACAGKPLVVAVLMETDPSIVDWKDFSEDSNTALHLAAEDGHISVVKLLVELAHADTTIQNAQGKTALQVAQNAEIREYLNSV